MLVNPAWYSPATAPCIVRAAPAKKRNTSATAGISSASTAAWGLPQLRDSIVASSAAAPSMRSASLSNAVARSLGEVADQPAKAASAALTAASICSGEASGTFASSLPLAGSSTGSSLPLPATDLP